MTAGLYLIAVPAVAEQTNRAGRVTVPAAPAAIRCMAVPAAVWTETDPARLEAAARELAAAADWLREQRGDTARATPHLDHPTLFTLDAP